MYILNIPVKHEDPVPFLLVKKKILEQTPLTHYTFIVHFHNLDAPQNWGHGVREGGGRGHWDSMGGI